MSPQLEVSISEISLPGKGKSLPLMTVIILIHMEIFFSLSFFIVFFFNFTTIILKFRKKSKKLIQNLVTFSNHIRKYSNLIIIIFIFFFYISLE